MIAIRGVFIVITACGLIIGSYSEKKQEPVVKSVQPPAVQRILDLNVPPLIALPRDSFMVKDTAGYGAARDSINSSIGDLPSLQHICSLSVHAVQEILTNKHTAGLDIYTTRPDTTYGTPYETTVYNLITAYAKLLPYGVPLSGKLPNLVRTRAITDAASLRLLPRQPGTGALGNGRFFFLGAGPFMHKRTPDSTEVFRNQQNQVELRYVCNTSENTEYLLRAVRRFPHVRINVSYGPALASYDRGPQSVRGIGSLEHILNDRIPVYFLSEKGAAKAELVSVTVKLVEEGFCASELPTIQLASALPPEKEILAVFIPYDTTDISRCMVKRKGSLWTADINCDNVPDLAGVFHTFTGILGDKLASMVWYVNIGGTWKVLDLAEELDCT
jgi:hypothetical protein